MQSPNNLNHFFRNGEEVWFYEDEAIYHGTVVDADPAKSGYTIILPDVSLRDPPEMEIPTHHIFETKEEAVKGLLLFARVDVKRAEFSVEKAKAKYKEIKNYCERFLNNVK